MPEWMIVVAIAIGVLLALSMLRAIIRSPLGVIGGLLRNLVIGCAALLIIDYAGKSFGVHVPLNGYTAGVASILGVPGVAALAVIEKWIV